MNEDWMRFAHTGRVADYLAYSRTAENPVYGRAANASGCGRTEDFAAGAGHTGADTGRDQAESEARDGADHCAYRYGAGSHTHRGL